MTDFGQGMPLKSDSANQKVFCGNCVLSFGGFCDKMREKLIWGVGQNEKENFTL